MPESSPTIWRAALAAWAADVTLDRLRQPRGDGHVRGERGQEPLGVLGNERLPGVGQKVLGRLSGMAGQLRPVDAEHLDRHAAGGRHLAVGEYLAGDLRQPDQDRMGAGLRKQPLG